MTTNTVARPDVDAGRKKTTRRRRQQAALRRRRRQQVVATVGLVAVAAVVAAMMLSSRPASSATARQAPAFTLTDTTGRQISLKEFRGRNVLLYFNEGAGCQSCLVQMAEIEKRAEELASLDLTVLPIVMNTRDQITADMAANGVTTPFLLDDGAVSDAYGTLGKGMHQGLPGHSFVLIDADGVQRWYGEYPSMWLAPDDLFDEVRDHLPA
jgi:peroxiredoxin